MTAFNQVIANTPSHQLNSVASTAMAILTGLVLLLCFVIERKPDPVLVGLWLSFLGAWKGINVKQFAIKRDSEFVPPGATPNPARVATPPGGG